MSISNTTIAAIQSAGQALSVAQTALATAAHEQAARVAQAMAANAYGLENDAHFEQWKAIARMAQALEGMEAQLKALYQTVGELALQAPVPSSGPRSVTPPRLASRVEAEPASDVTARPAGAKREAGQRAGVKPAAALKGNAQRLMAYLSKRIDRRRYVRLTHSDIAAATALPLGSVGAALTALQQKGLLLEGERGSYKLA